MTTDCESALYAHPRLPISVKYMTTKNPWNLASIHKVILKEEAEEIKMDEALTRILKFYHKTIPYGIR